MLLQTKAIFQLNQCYKKCGYEVNVMFLIGDLIVINSGYVPKDFIVLLLAFFMQEGSQVSRKTNVCAYMKLYYGTSCVCMI